MLSLSELPASVSQPEQPSVVIVPISQVRALAGSCELLPPRALPSELRLLKRPGRGGLQRGMRREVQALPSCLAGAGGRGCVTLQRKRGLGRRQI